jgi:hypothetical protein
MALNLKLEQILLLAPDASSAKAARGLAQLNKWPTLGHSERAAWGECQGSSAKPYQARVDLSEMGYQCSCPSRKIPCKHTLGLLILLHDQPAAFSNGEPPAWVAEWLEGRTRRAQQRQEKQQERQKKATDPRAQAKRASERHAKTEAGLHELELWLRDMMRQGLAAVQGQPHSFWATPAARMTDAQAPGVARLLHQMAALPVAGDDWAERLLAQAGRLYLLIAGFKRLDELPEATQAEIRSVLGWPQSQDELLAQAGQRDCWLVVGQRVVENETERLHTQFSWLWSNTSRRPALVLDFAHGSTPLDKSLVPGNAIDAELVYFPGAFPLRSLVKTRHATLEAPAGLSGYASITEALDTYAAALAASPWLERLLLPLQAVVLAHHGDTWMVHDEAGHTLPLSPQFEQPWQLFALSGGHPLALAGEWDGRYLLPLGVWAEGGFQQL